MKLLAALLSLSIPLLAQTPTFEVASIKPNKSGDGGSSIRAAPGQIAMQNVPLRKVTLWAYGIPDDREYALSGPDWLGADRFDIVAKLPAGATFDQAREMTRALLADRFRLELHRETRQLPSYSLVVAKGGAKIKPVEDGAPRTDGRPGHLEATRIPMRKLADLFARQIGYPVVDGTGMTGVYTFTLEWSPDETMKLSLPDESAPRSGSGPSIFAALQEQLGLRLEGKKAPVEVLVVDRVERVPTEN